MLAWAKGIVAEFALSMGGERSSRGWAVFLIVRMSLKRPGIMVAIWRRRCTRRRGTV